MTKKDVGDDRAKCVRPLLYVYMYVFIIICMCVYIYISACIFREQQNNLWNLYVHMYV